MRMLVAGVLGVVGAAATQRSRADEPAPPSSTMPAGSHEAPHRPLLLEAALVLAFEPIRSELAPGACIRLRYRFQHFFGFLASFRYIDDRLGSGSTDARNHYVDLTLGFEIWGKIARSVTLSGSLGLIPYGTQRYDGGGWSGTGGYLGMNVTYTMLPFLDLGLGVGWSGIVYSDGDVHGGSTWISSEASAALRF